MNQIRVSVRVRVHTEVLSLPPTDLSPSARSPRGPFRAVLQTFAVVFLGFIVAVGGLRGEAGRTVTAGLTRVVAIFTLPAAVRPARYCVATSHQEMQFTKETKGSMTRRAMPARPYAAVFRALASVHVSEVNIP